jgi:autoinducer-2 kinase
MAKTRYVMAFDAGTGAGRCAIMDVQGYLIASAYAEWGYTPASEAPEYGSVFAAEEFWAILARLSQEVIAKSKVDPADIIGVSTTSQRHGMVFIDAKGKEIYAGPNIDGRGFTEAQQLEPIADEVYSITGQKPSGMYGLSRLAWFKKHDPATYANIHHVMMISDWITYRLSGVSTSEPSVASSSQLLNLTERNWSHRVMELGSLRTDIFPQVSEAGTRIGTITGPAAKDTGLVAGTAIAIGGGDTQIGLVGMNLTEPNQIGAVAGTTTPLMLILDKVLIDAEQRVSTNCHVLPNRWTLESNARGTGMPFRWVRDTFAQAETQAAEAQGGDPYEYLNEQAAQVGPGADGMMAFIGSGAADRMGNSNLGGFVFPISWTLGRYDRRHFYRAALEAMVYGIRTNADQLASIVDIGLERINVCGGQTKSGLFNQVLANTMNTPVHIFEVKEATCLGAGICAAVGAGEYADLRAAAKAMVRVGQIVAPQPEEVDRYQDAYDRWVDVSKSLSNFPV